MEGFCAGLADAQAAKNQDWASVYGQCVYRDAVQEQHLWNLLLHQGWPVREPRIWSTIYDWPEFLGPLKACIDDAKDAALGTKCKAILPSVNPMFNTTRSGDSKPEAILAECKSLLAGLEAKAVTEVENCVRKEKFPVSSCVEGLDSTVAGICTDPGVHERVVDLKAACDQLLTVSSADEGVMNRDLCLGIGTRLRAHPANEFVGGIKLLVQMASPAHRQLRHPAARRKGHQERLPQRGGRRRVQRARRQGQDVRHEQRGRSPHA
ncbi:MAG: hypothetical protein U0235_14200 [Polyangiaceae bacterium]